MKTIVEFLFGSGVIFALLNIVKSNKEIYINSINNKRTNSNNELRREISKVIAYCMLTIKANNNNKDLNDYKNQFEFYKAIAMSRMHLSIHPERTGNEGHDILDNMLKAIQELKTIDEKTTEEIILLTRQILDFEWNRVKKEAKGNY